jgi:hypothetical protein
LLRLGTILIAALLLCGPAFAQGVQQSGKVTPRHGAMWTTNGVVQDVGGAAGGPTGTGLSELGITNTGLPFCINDAPTTSSGWHQLCLGATGAGPQITYNAFGTATPNTLTCLINGSTYSCLPSGGDVAGPSSSVGFDVASFNGSTGKVIQDSGIAAQSASPPNGSFASWLNTNNVLGQNPYGYLGKFGLLVSPNNYGEPAIVGASQSTQTPMGNVCCSIAVAGVGLNNNTATPQGSWIFYSTGSRLAGAGSLVNEFDIFNGGSLVTSNSYSSPNGQTAILAVQCGGEPISLGLSGNPCSAGITIGDNGLTLNEGIVFKNASISGPNEPAIEMAGGQSILWTYDNTGPTNFGAQISSTVGSSADAMSQVFVNNGVQWRDHAGNTNFLIGNNPTVPVIANYLEVMGEATGNPAVLSAQGTDTNITIQLFPKGSLGMVQSTASFSIGGGMAVAALEFALGFGKQASPSGLAPGAGEFKMEVVAGTGGGTCKLIAYAGTSGTPTTIIDNVGGGC